MDLLIAAAIVICCLFLPLLVDVVRNVPYLFEARYCMCGAVNYICTMGTDNVDIDQILDDLKADHVPWHMRRKVKQEYKRLRDYRKYL